MEVGDDPSQANEDLSRILNDLGFVTGSETLMPLVRQVFKAACVSDIAILLEGERGASKQALAYAIHCLDRKRLASPFVIMRCGSLSEELAESELFGRGKTAFSGSVAQVTGLFQRAQGGTLFLEDVNELPPHAQAKLLDVLQRNVVHAIGSDLEAQVDVRTIAASNLPLEPLVRQNRFRADLYRRLKVVRLFLPPLRDGMQHLPGLVLAFAHRHPDIDHASEKLKPKLVSFLKSQLFSGNGRELQNGDGSGIS